MNDSNPTILDLMTKLHGTGSHERRALLLEIIDLADAQNDLDSAFTARARYVTACHGASDQLHMISNYGWCLARHDEDPERFPISLWEYKWVVGAANYFSGISRTQLGELVEDMARRFDAIGGSKGPAGVARCEAAASLGDLDQLPALLAEWKDTPKVGRLNDCATCDITSEVFLLTELGRYEDAIIAADPVITGGRSCATQPHYAYADLLAAARSVGDAELAQMLSVVGLELLKNLLSIHPTLPVLVVSRDEVIPVVNNVIVAPVTSTIRTIPTCIPVGVDEGTDHDSVATFDNLASVPKSVLTRRLGQLRVGGRQQICSALNAMANC